MNKKARETVELLRKIYGPDEPTFPGSPHEGEELDNAEVILHELAHQTMMPADYVFAPGRMWPSHREMIEYIDTLHRYQQDLMEIRAVAIELTVANRLNLKLDRRRVLHSAIGNSELYKGCLLDEFDRIVKIAQRTPKVRYHADTILCLIEETRKTYGPIRVSIHSRRQQTATRD